MQFLKDVFNLFFPRTCACCDEELVRNEHIVCLKCRFELPLTNFTNEKNNVVEQIFYGRVKIEFATSLFFFRNKGKSQKLISQLKYNGKQEIGYVLGKWLGHELKTSERFSGVDYIIPVPLHPKKLKKRGYNQLTLFGKGLAEILETPYLENILIKKSDSGTQTIKQRLDRWKNVSEIFYLTNNSIFENKHILIIDDVITTGATLEACALALSKTNNIKYSIATMVYTD